MSLPHNQFPAIRDQVRTDCAQPTLPGALSPVLSTARRSTGKLMEAAPCITDGDRHVNAHSGPKAAEPMCAGASPRIEAPAFFELCVELAPFRERAAIWVVCIMGPWVSILWAGRCKGWW